MNYPPMYRVHQKYDTTALSDITQAVVQEFSSMDLSGKVKPGQRVGITVGSRGIAGLVPLVSSVVGCLRDMGLEPFILPAMGSHGGATAQGQTELLDHLGVTESSVNAPIVSSMDTASLGSLPSGAQVFFSKDALEADHLVAMNRMKPHTAFHGPVESGLCKILAVGCGKHKGAQQMHRFGLGESIVPAAEMILKKAPVLCGLAVVENSLEQVHTLKLVLPEKFASTDAELLKLARRMLPKIPLEYLDVLIVDEFGKNISGTGIDPNVIGFWRRWGGPRTPDYRTIVVLDLTDASDGNGLGIGMTELTTKRVMDKIDLKKTYTNSITTGIFSSVKLPIPLKNDKAAVDTALGAVPVLGKTAMVRIKNTLMLETFWASEVLLPALRELDHIEIDQRPLMMRFDQNGRLLPFAD